MTKQERLIWARITIDKFTQQLREIKLYKILKERGIEMESSFVYTEEHERMIERGIRRAIGIMNSSGVNLNN